MGIELATIDNLKKAYAALPEKQRTDQKLSARDAVRLLADEITGLQARGYTADEIVKIASSHNVQLSAHTLRKYLSDIRLEAPKSKRKMPAKKAKLPRVSRAAQASVTPTRARKK